MADLSALRGFHRNFWLINLIELVERGAYYGITSVLTFHLVTQRGIPTAVVGAEVALLLIFAYFFPVIAGALAEKYGFRPSMFVAFGLVFLGYLALGMSGAFAALGVLSPLPGIIMLGLGSGIFKPIATAVIADSTTTEKRGFGFTIYYAGINIGGFLGPLLIGVFVPEALYGAVFYGAAVAVLLNFVILLFFYRDVRPPQPSVSVTAALARLAEARHDRWFLLLLVAYSGLWVMYAQQLYFAGLYMSDFVTGVPSWFNVALVQTVNPGVIILVGPVLGYLVTKYPSLAVVIGGIVLYVIGMLAMGGGTIWAWFLFGITLTSIGEVIAHPNFLSYVSKVAPEGRAAMYLGYGFIPVGVGLVVGATLGGVAYAHFAETGRTPGLYWALMGAIGVLSLAGMLYVNRRMGARQTDAVALRGTAGRVVDSRVAPLAVLVLIPLLLVAGAAPGAQPYFREGADGPGPATMAGGRVVALQAIDGELNEGQSRASTVQVPSAQARNVTFTLRWTDEATATGPLPGASNAPDTFRMSITTPDGRNLTSEESANPPGGEGVLAFEVPGLAGRAPDGAYRVLVELVQAGDTVVGPGLPGPADGGNAYTLEPSYIAPP